MSVWQLIETAPRDGTVIEVAADACGSFPMRWNPKGFNPLASRKPGLWEIPDGSMTWTEDDGAGPTHWRYHAH